ncbi:MAG: hypothetical protein H0Z40_08565 [Desulfotomaculum sp.]|nr:hypothetical protein [Desulfotomaculum sp.]
MSESEKFNALKDMIDKNKIKINLDRRRCIEYYNEKVYQGEIMLSKSMLRLRTLSDLAGYSLVIGLFCIFFVDPWLYGLLIAVSGIYVRYTVWKYLKNVALDYTRQDILKSEENLTRLYRRCAFTLQNIENGKTARHPEHWTAVLPK